MKLLKTIVAAIIMFSGVFSYTPPCDAQNEVLKIECETKAIQAAELIKKLGAEAAFKRITDPDGPFVGDKSHVFCINADTGVLLAHKISWFVGFDMNKYMDADMNARYTDILERAGKTGNGWSTYMTYGSGPEKRKTPGLKNMYFLKVPDEKIVLCCGYWDDD